MHRNGMADAVQHTLDDAGPCVLCDANDDGGGMDGMDGMEGGGGRWREYE